MQKISDVISTVPEVFSNELQERAYKALGQLGVSFERVDNSPAASMEDCIAIGEKLGCEVVKNIFLCNRQQTVFYL
ncbi:MAG: prolyl-tRNA synthetase associated domain-containing protein, partial [Bacteroidales bacterium]|nr:prolyl-tRNA synthetase associated domain-containing protein [Bacteroidales bacterium]